MVLVADLILVRFINETENLETLYDTVVNDGSLLEYQQERRTRSQKAQSHPSHLLRDHQQPDQLPQEEEQPAQTFADQEFLCIPPQDSRLCLCRPSSTPSEDQVFPLRNPREVRLLRYYLEHMCRWVSMTASVQGSLA